MCHIMIYCIILLIAYYAETADTGAGADADAGTDEGASTGDIRTTRRLPPRVLVLRPRSTP